MIDQQIVHVALVVDDYDKAISFYRDKLGFILHEDTTLSPEKKWVIIGPPGNGNCNLLLAKGVGDQQIDKIGNQTGGRVFLFLKTNDFWRDYHSMLEKGINFTREPAKETYGTVAVFEDLYGNKWDLIEYSR